MMPRFFKDMPPRMGGHWRAAVTRHGRAERYAWRGTFNGLRRAYIAARLMALWYDLVTPDCDGEIGIRWIVQPAKDKA